MNTTQTAPQTGVQRGRQAGSATVERAVPALTIVLAVAGAMLLAGCRNDPSQSVIVSPDAVGADTSPDPTTPTNAVESAGVEAASPGETALTAGDTAPELVIESVPEVGTPGLDSTDVFCAGWSAWAGSQQVIAVTANFADPATVPSLEVTAAPTMVGAYDSMLANWPEAIAGEREVAANEYFGPMYFRISESLAALTEVGADQATIDSIQAAWFTALESRDPTTPEFSVDLPDETWQYVDSAAELVSARVPEFLSDENLLIDVNTDSIDNYIAETCPDRGTLGGLDIEESG